VILEIIRTLSPYMPGSFEGSNRYRVAWAGSRGRARACAAATGSPRWDGSVDLSAEKIAGATAFAMENPEKGIVAETPTSPTAVRSPSPPAASTSA
jgi:hypothetical protein